ncbi:MAG TPA: DUF899 domain-containing protein [Gaiellaceae bacterium]|nr:DUF899 domain-containing protein [Gaiellaceae bacterium]
MAVEHEIVTHDAWVAARKELLAREKEFTRLRDGLSRRRRELPWEPVDKEYVFEGADGRSPLPELFDGRSQLVVYHFMFDPEWEEGCKSCSFWADSFEANVVHLKARDVTMVAVSRARYRKLAAYRERMGWSFPWFSSAETDFNFDFGVSFAGADQEQEGAYNYGTLAPRGPEREGVSVFYKGADGGVYHTYSTYARGIDLLNTAYNYLDLVPKGRDEDGGRPQGWVRRHDEYDG